MILGLSPLGFFHTAISILAIPFALVALLRDGKINPTNLVGKGYLITMLIGCVTAFGIYHHGGFGPGHVLSIITLVLLLIGFLAGRGSWLGRAAPYVQTISFSLTILLLMVFTTTESLTRLPVGHPYAANQDDPALGPVRLVLLIAFVVGVGYQVFKLRAAHKHS
jgi:uncharacterized membrane protein